MSIFELYWLFAKISMFTYGGGYAMIPLFYDELVNSAGLLSASEFGDIVAIAQMTPGPIGVNAATYAGFVNGGLAGAALATLGMVTPALLIVPLIAGNFDRFRDSRLAKGILSGIRPATLGLVAAAVVFFAEMSIFTTRIPFERLLGAPADSAADFAVSWSAAVIFAAALVATIKYKLSIPLVVLAAALLGALTL